MQNVLTKERDSALIDANSFRDDVRYLTIETERLLKELNQRNNDSKVIADKREISALRDFKTILDRDKEQLVTQNSQLIKEKDDLI